MWYKVIDRWISPAPKNYTLPDGRRVFNFNRNAPLLLAYGYAETIVEGESTEEVEWYSQEGAVITHHPALIPDPTEEDAEETEVTADAGE